jgi:hypothetical protein
MHLTVNVALQTATVIRSAADTEVACQHATRRPIQERRSTFAFFDALMNLRDAEIVLFCGAEHRRYEAEQNYTSEPWHKGRRDSYARRAERQLIGHRRASADCKNEELRANFTFGKSLESAFSSGGTARRYMSALVPQHGRGEAHVSPCWDWRSGAAAAR